MDNGVDEEYMKWRQACDFCKKYGLPPPKKQWKEVICQPMTIKDIVEETTRRIEAAYGTNK